MPQKYLNTPIHILSAVFLPVLLIIGCVKYAERNHADIVSNSSVTVVTDCVNVSVDTGSVCKIKLTSVEFKRGEHKYMMFVDENNRQITGIIHSPNCSCKENKQ